MKQKSRILNRVFAVASTLAMTLPMLNGLITASAAETEQYPYTLFGRNGISVNTSHLCINGNLHANTTVEITSNSRNVNGKITTADTEIDRVKHVYADSKIYETYFAENGTVYEEAYTWDEMNIHVNSPVFSYGNMDVSGNISLNSCLGSFMDLTLTGEVSNANNAVLYSKYGDITVDTDNVANINGLIYAPLGTLTIDAPNINLNGVIIADTIVINGSTVNINGNSNLARFIGNTSEAYDFSGLEYLPEAWLGDADEDGLFDLYEKVIDTDPQNEDTDGDALPDGHEVLILNTDPLLTDSDDNGIADSDEDFDTDGLTNLEEYLYQTEPFTADTDNDGLTDGEEVHTTKTNPLDSDTDDDKLIDGDEGENGAIYLQYGILFEPLQPDTDGNGILDGDEVFGQTLEQEIVTEDEVITQVIVDMETNGNIAQNLTIESMQDVDALSSNVVGLIGEPLEFTSATEFDSATISFTIDQSQLGDTAFDNLLILWYNEEEGIFEEMPTDRDRVNSTVSTTTTHFSQYLVVDSVKWYASWENGFRQMDDACGDDIVVEYPLHTYFLIDCSEKMGDVDPFNRRKTICQNIIDNMQSFDKASVATFSRGIAFDSDLTSSKSTLNYYLSRINNDGSETNIAAALGPTLTEIYETIPGEPYRIIILTHGGADFNAVKAAMWQFDNQFENGTVNIINLSSSVLSEDAISFAQHSGGNVYYAAEVHELTTQVGTAITYPAPFDNTDRDGDSIPDIVERYGLKPDGTLINSDPYKTDTDGDGLTDSEELGFVPFDAILHAPGEYLQHITYRSDPNNQDTDGDGILDYNEHHWNGIDDRYINLNALAQDTLEQLYPEFSEFKNNPVSIKIEDNHITIRANIRFTGDVDIQPDGFPMTYRQAVIAGIKEHWSIEFMGNLYDFYPGMRITVDVEIVDVSDRVLMGNCFRVKILDKEGGSFRQGSTWNQETMRYIQLSLKGKSFEAVKSVAAHEFGHNLGLKDAYGDALCNHGFAPTMIDLNTPTNNEIWYERSGAAPQVRGLIMWMEGYASANDIEMVLEAFLTDEIQYYVPYGRDQKVSSAIKSGANVYVNKTTGVVMYYEFDPELCEFIEIGDAEQYQKWVLNKYNILLNLGDLNDAW